MSSLHFMFLLFGIFAVSLKHARAFTAEEITAIRAVLRPFIQECGKEFNIDEEEIKKAKETDNLDNLDPCLFACFGKKLGVLNEKGDFDKEKATEMTKKFVTNEDEQKKALEMIEKCSSVNDEPVGDDKGCDRAVLLYKCFAPYKNQFSLTR